MWKPFGGPGRHDDTTLIARTAVFEGTIRFSGVLEVEGRVLGDVLASDNEQAVVRILKTGQVSGNIDAPLVVVDGAVTGKHPIGRPCRAGVERDRQRQCVLQPDRDGEGGPGQRQPGFR